jgi:hypothetical protein
MLDFYFDYFYTFFTSLNGVFLIINLKGNKMEILRKITVKAVAGKVDIEKVLAAPEKKMTLAKIFGIASKAAPDQSDYGAFLRFKGRFRAINYVDGTQFESGSLILPPVAQDMLAGVLEGVDGSVEFGFEVGVKYDAEAVTKYVYTVTPLFEASKDDPLQRLSNTVLSIAKKEDAPAEALPKPRPLIKAKTNNHASD